MGRLFLINILLLAGIAMATLVLKTWDAIETKRSSVTDRDEAGDDRQAQA